jgi:putative ABC transport system permease protein
VLLAAVGISCVLAAWASARTREFGIRMALGAAPRQVEGLVLRHALGLVALGLAAGVILSAAATRGLASLLHGVRPGDPLALAGSAALLCAMALAAGSLPARRAARTDPMVSLRRE